MNSAYTMLDGIGVSAPIDTLADKRQNIWRPDKVPRPTTSTPFHKNACYDNATRTPARIELLTSSVNSSSHPLHIKILL